MTTVKKSHELFGEEFEGYDVTTFTVKDGQGYYISYPVDNTRTAYTQYRIRVDYSDGDTVFETVDSRQELELWTVHLK